VAFGLVSGDAIRPYHLPVDPATPIEPKEQWEEACEFMLTLRTLGSMVALSVSVALVAISCSLWFGGCRRITTQMTSL
jgi:hypothetical protein